MLQLKRWWCTNVTGGSNNDDDNDSDDDEDDDDNGIGAMIISRRWCFITASQWWSKHEHMSYLTANKCLYIVCSINTVQTVASKDTPLTPEYDKTSWSIVLDPP